MENKRNNAYNNGLSPESNGKILRRWKAYRLLVGLETQGDPLNCPKIGRETRLAAFNALKDQISFIESSVTRKDVVGEKEISLKTGREIGRFIKLLRKYGKCPESEI